MSPIISVVMGVRNAESILAQTISSVLLQDMPDFEFIIIDDGSVDKTPHILQEAQEKDSRIVVITREGRGLTEALIEGCSIARGKYIARQDAGDISLPGRLTSQLRLLQDQSNIAMCSTLVRFVTLEGITAFVTSSDKMEEDKLTGIIHGSVMMRRDMYEQSGGYRRQFYYAQDVDLWSRIMELGDHYCLPLVYYEGLLFPDSISGSKKKEQERLFSLIKELKKARRSGMEETVLLDLAGKLSLSYRKQSTRKKSTASGAYFIASCLATREPQLAAKYLKLVLKSNPTHLRAMIRLALIK